jgi:hypothetical protein
MTAPALSDDAADPAFGATRAGLDRRALWDTGRWSRVPSRSPNRTRTRDRHLGDAPVRGLAGPVGSLVGALRRTEVYELGQVVVTLSAVILTVTHCGFGPANPGYGPPVYLCDRSLISVPFGSSARDAVPCT